MGCRKLNYINDNVIILLVMIMYEVSDGNDGDVTHKDDGNDYVFHGDCDNNAYDIFFIYF